MSAEKQPLLPMAYGNEEETMMLVAPEGSTYADYEEPKSFVGNFEKFIPPNLKRVNEGLRRWHLQNGGVVYNGGGNAGAANLERTTPECSTPTEYANAVQANEKLLVAMVGNYIRHRYKHGEPEVARIQRRTVDTKGNSRASHMSLEIKNQAILADERGRNLKTLMLAHIATRSFMTGAGHISNFGANYGGKLSTVKQIEGYGYSSHAFRVNSTADTGYRWEIRCGDINLSPWALKVGSGGAAMLFAAAQTELAKPLLAGVPSILQEPDLYFLHAAHMYNRMELDEEGQLKTQTNDIVRVNFQERIFTLLASRLGEYVEVSEEDQLVMEEIVEYCQDFRKVMRGKEDWRYLMDRSDVAAKFAKIAASIQRGRDDGEERSATDDKSKGWDLRYDLIEVKPGIRGAPRVEYGYGYRLRDKGNFRLGLSEAAVEKAFYMPPTTTRAHIRGELIRRELLSCAEYSNVVFCHETGIGDGQTQELGPVVLEPKLFSSAEEFVDLVAAYDDSDDNKTDN